MPVPKSYELAEQPSAKEWSQWFRPVPQANQSPFRFACCDCGLVHDMEFQAVASTPDEAHLPEVYIEFRVRRNARSSAQARRHVDYPARLAIKGADKLGRWLDGPSPREDEEDGPPRQAP